MTTLRVATLAGSGTTDYKRALAWATITTLMGSLTAVVLAETLLKSFSGKGLVSSELAATPEYGAAGCGSLFGIGTVTQQAQWSVIGKILRAWLMTLPLGAALGALCYWCSSLSDGRGLEGLCEFVQSDSRAILLQ